MIEPIKLDLALSDQQVALIFGTAAGFINALVSLPIGRYFADRYSRKLIIGLGLLVLGITSIWQRARRYRHAVARRAPCGGVGGAGNGPATFSMLGDMFPAAKLPRPWPS